MKKIFLIALIGLNISASRANETKFELLGKNTLTTVGVITGSYLAYVTGVRVFKYVKTKITAKLEQEFINLIKLQFKLNTLCTKSELKLKARFTNMRKRLMERLNLIDATDERWTPEFQQQVDSYNTILGVIDSVKDMTDIGFLANEYQDEYDIPYEKLNVVEKALINNQVNSILFSYKPDNLCSEQELIKKQEQKVAGEKFVQRLEKELAGSALKKVLNILTLYVFMF